MDTEKENGRFTRLGNLLVDLSTVEAVQPLHSEPSDGFGFRLVTTSGSLEVTDDQSREAIRERFYPESSHM
jgi:hypothetical protein